MREILLVLIACIAVATLVLSSRISREEEKRLENVSVEEGGNNG